VRRANRERLLSGIPERWRAPLRNAIEAESFGDLADYLATERMRPKTEIYPGESDVFRALQITRLDAVRAVILGQDPYHGEGQAHGLAFSVPQGIQPPPSLRNILAEWRSDLCLEPASIGSLEPWAHNGVLLLNTVLTVRRGEANSHRDMGWEPFTDAIISAVAARPAPVVFMLWGWPARRRRSLIDARHVIVESNHPSPLSATRGPTPFVGSHPFSTANARLAALGRSPIDWALGASA
jgi:uracil-DNA glycosylase